MIDPDHQEFCRALDFNKASTWIGNVTVDEYGAFREVRILLATPVLLLISHNPQKYTKVRERNIKWMEVCPFTAFLS
jgi:hypothetical protein